MPIPINSIEKTIYSNESPNFSSFDTSAFSLGSIYFNAELNEFPNDVLNE